MKRLLRYHSTQYYPCKTWHAKLPLFLSSSSYSISKKDLSHPIANAYYPQQVEQGWYSWWEQQGYFTPDLHSSRPSFSMVLPPPNVTGSLHIGHALTSSIQDTLCRFKKMKGYNVCWIPGTDHAGISTQIVVEKKIAREQQKSRYDLGREEFLKQVWEWKDKYAHRIVEQMRASGSMTDWTRQVFTLDSNRSTAVTEAFVRLFESGLIYRAEKIVNWCPALRTAISDIELETISLTKSTKLQVPSCGNQYFEFGVIHTFLYPIENSSETIPVSTTRIETMLGDTAIAIHSQDSRYKHLHGKYAMHPLLHRRIPIICDDILVTPELGTGAVKITPAHSLEDFACAERHHLTILPIFHKDGTLIKEIVGEDYANYNRFSVRSVLISKLKQLNLYVDKKDHTMELPICSRSKDIIEPMIIPQWFVKCKEMAHTSLELVKNGTMNIIPSNNQIIWNRWLENIHDWCISRQLWWGHRIPAYKIITNPSQQQEKWIVARNIEEAHSKMKQLHPTMIEYTLEQDEDVLDTWFSSGLYPLSVFGWPNESSKELELFYPLDVMETGSDILFFWVARMSMLCTFLHNNHTPPFKDIYLHAMVRDAQGRKMSKSLGNVIDPVDIVKGVSLQTLKEQVLQNTNVNAEEVKKAIKSLEKDYPNGIEECGTDALRFTLLQYTQQGRQINLDVQRAVGNRHFCNKMWQASKFAFSNFEQHKGLYIPQEYNHHHHQQMLYSHFEFQNQWILSKLSQLIVQVNEYLNQYQFSEAAYACYNFFLYQFCDLYLEIIKPIFKDSNQMAKKNTLHTLHVVLDTIYKLFHPMMPFITEELWQRLNQLTNQNKNKESIMETQFPDQILYSNSKVETEMETLFTIVQSIRSFVTQQQSTVASLKIVSGYLIVDSKETELKQLLVDRCSELQVLTKLKQLQITDNNTQIEDKFVLVFGVNKSIKLIIPVQKEDITNSISSSNKKLNQIRNLIGKLESQLQMQNVPEVVRDQKFKQLQDCIKEADVLQEGIKTMEASLIA